MGPPAIFLEDLGFGVALRCASLILPYAEKTCGMAQVNSGITLSEPTLRNVSDVVLVVLTLITLPIAIRVKKLLGSGI